MSIQHLDDNKGRQFFCAAFSVSVSLKYAAVVLDELDHDLVADILVLYCLETRSHAEKEGVERKNKKLNSLEI